MSQFLELGISKEIVAILNQNGITIPTEIQEKALPAFQLTYLLNFF